MSNKNTHTKKAGKNMMALAEAMAMNAIPEYWVSVKTAGLHLFSLCMLAKQLFSHH